MKQYDLVLKNEKEKSYSRISWIIVVLNVISLLLIAMADYKNTKGPALIILLSCLFIIALASSATFIKIGSKYGKMSLTGAMFWLSIPWLATEHKWVFIVDILFVILNIISARKLIVTIKNDNIIFPSFPKKTIQWQQLNNLILKDDLLTIDFKNNKLIQQKISEASSTIDEKEFNEFCCQQLNK